VRVAKPKAAAASSEVAPVRPATRKADARRELAAGASREPDYGI
jgi:hypothetical protein